MNTDIDQVIDHTLELTDIIMQEVADVSFRAQCFEKITQYLLDDQVCSVEASKKILLQCFKIHQFDQKLKEKMISVREKYLDELIVHATHCRQTLCNQFTQVSHVLIEDHQEKSAQSPKPLTMRRA